LKRKEIAKTSAPSVRKRIEGKDLGEILNEPKECDDAGRLTGSVALTTKDSSIKVIGPSRTSTRCRTAVKKERDIGEMKVGGAEDAETEGPKLRVEGRTKDNFAVETSRPGRDRRRP
jgi:hypothetical protein